MEVEKVALFRGSKEVLEEKNKIYDKYVLIVEKEEEDIGKSNEELLGELRRYKIGDGVSHYNDLPYGKGLIPIVFKLPNINYMNEEEIKKMNDNKRTKVIIFVLWLLIGIFSIINGPTRFTYGCCWGGLLAELFYNIIKD